MTHRQKKKQSVEINSEETQALDVLDKDIKSVFFNIFKGLKKTMSKELKESIFFRIRIK